MEGENFLKQKFNTLHTSPEVESAIDLEEHSFKLWSKCFSEVESGNFFPEISRNDKGEILAPNGEVSKLPNEDFIKVTRTPTFKSWFGESKATDDVTSEPILVYHGTDANIRIEDGLDTEHSKGLIKKLWFTSKRDSAVNYGEIKRDSRFGSSFRDPVKTQIVSAFLKMQNPEIVDAYPGGINPNFYVMWIQLKKLGESDGIIAKERGTYILFNSDNVMHLPSDIGKS